jgi:hypothetical protein
VRSDTSGVIETALGARISVPVGAVPRTDQGNVGTIVFSVGGTTILRSRRSCGPSFRTCISLVPKASLPGG